MFEIETYHYPGRNITYLSILLIYKHHIKWTTKYTINKPQKKIIQLKINEQSKWLVSSNHNFTSYKNLYM